MTDDKKQQAPMDPTAREGATVVHVNQPRNTYGMDVLISEVLGLFPETIYEVSNRNPRGVAFDVTFDLSSIPEDDRSTFLPLLTLLGDPAYNEDPRIADITADAEGVLVSFRNNPAIQDNRTPFGLADAWTILNGEES